MSNQITPTHHQRADRRGEYPLMTPRQKYNLASCSPEEIDVVEQFRAFVDKAIIPYRHDLEGGWHRDGKLAKDTVHRLYNVEDPSQQYRSVKTIAKRDGGSYVLNGHKFWPGPAGRAELFETEHLAGHLGYWVTAVTHPDGGEDNVGIFYVPPRAEGLEFSQPYEKMGFSFTEDNTDIWFTDVRNLERYRIDTKPGQATELIKGYIIGLGRLASLTLYWRSSWTGPNIVPSKVRLCGSGHFSRRHLARCFAPSICPVNAT